jgi:hypothetical protein
MKTRMRLRSPLLPGFIYRAMGENQHAVLPTKRR